MNYEQIKQTLSDEPGVVFHIAEEDYYFVASVKYEDIRIVKPPIFWDVRFVDFLKKEIVYEIKIADFEYYTKK